MASQGVRVGVNAGDYDPIPMRFYNVVRDEVNGEPKTTYEYVYERHIRVMSGMTREARFQGRQENVSVDVFRIRRTDTDSGMTEIDERYVAKWRGRSYEITGVNYPNLEELELYMTRSDKVLT